jgi:hypothetical protein
VAREQTQHESREFHADVDVQSWDELVALAHRGEQLPCGCDAHALLHKMLSS